MILVVRTYEDNPIQSNLRSTYGTDMFHIQFWSREKSCRQKVITKRNDFLIFQVITRDNQVR